MVCTYIGVYSLALSSTAGDSTLATRRLQDRSQPTSAPRCDPPRTIGQSQRAHPDIDGNLAPPISLRRSSKDPDDDVLLFFSPFSPEGDSLDAVDL